MTEPATLVMPQCIADELSVDAAQPVETAAVLLVGLSRAGGPVRLLAREYIRVSHEQSHASQHDIIVASAEWVPALRRAAELGAGAVWVHTHPTGTPQPSDLDQVVDDELRDAFQIRTQTEVYGSLVVSPADPSGAGVDFTGRVWLGRQELPIGRLLTVGNRIRLRSAIDAPPTSHVPELYDRQVRAFGGEVQAALGQLRVAVVGVGGTGSAVCEQLARLGVRNLLLVDPDALGISNVSRVYGSEPDQVGQPKVEVAANHLRHIAPGITVRTVIGDTTRLEIARLLSGEDVIFGCTDDEAGRMTLSRLATYEMVPVIDIGVLIDSHAGVIDGIHARVTVLSPGKACLICRGRIDPARAAAEFADPAEHAERVREGYAPELAGIEPAVISFTTLAAAAAVGELLERLTGYGGGEPPGELLIRIHERQMSTNRRSPKRGHYCDQAAGCIGLGDQTPFLGQTWSR
jgi:ThiF family